MTKIVNYDVIPISQTKENLGNDRKTYIDPKIIPLSREFDEREIKEWLEEDRD